MSGRRARFVAKPERFLPVLQASDFNVCPGPCGTVHCTPLFNEEPKTYAGHEGSVIEEFKYGVLSEFVVKQLIPADVVATDSEQKLGLSVTIIIAAIDEPHS